MNMKFDMSWDAPARPIFRIIVVPLVILFYGMALLMLADWAHDCWIGKSLAWTTSIKVAIPALFWAVYFSFVVIRGKGFIKEHRKTEQAPSPYSSPAAGSESGEA
jgi:hypothetical protein